MYIHTYVHTYIRVCILTARHRFFCTFIQSSGAESQPTYIAIQVAGMTARSYLVVNGLTTWSLAYVHMYIHTHSESSFFRKRTFVWEWDQTSDCSSCQQRIPWNTDITFSSYRADGSRTVWTYDWNVSLSASGACVHTFMRKCTMYICTYSRRNCYRTFFWSNPGRANGPFYIWFFVCFRSIIMFILCFCICTVT